MSRGPAPVSLSSTLKTPSSSPQPRQQRRRPAPARLLLQGPAQWACRLRSPSEARQPRGAIVRSLRAAQQPPRQTTPDPHHVPCPHDELHQQHSITPAQPNAGGRLSHKSRAIGKDARGFEASFTSRTPTAPAPNSSFMTPGRGTWRTALSTSSLTLSGQQGRGIEGGRGQGGPRPWVQLGAALCLARRMAARRAGAGPAPGRARL